MFNKIHNWLVAQQPTTNTDHCVYIKNNKVVALPFRSITYLKNTYVTSTISAEPRKLYIVNEINNDIIINLPSCISTIEENIACKIQLDNMAGNTVTLTPNTGDTIDGQDSWVINIPRSYTVIRSDGISDWMVV